MAYPDKGIVLNTIKKGSIKPWEDMGEEVSLKRLQAAWLQQYDILVKAKLWRP